MDITKYSAPASDALQNLLYPTYIRDKAVCIEVHYFGRRCGLIPSRCSSFTALRGVHPTYHLCGLPLAALIKSRRLQAFYYWPLN